jgi:hypothetical protein
VVFKGRVSLPVAFGVGPVVDEDAAADDAVLRPVVDADSFRIGFEADEGLALGVVVEGVGGDVGEVAESVPLCATLGV